MPELRVESHHRGFYLNDDAPTIFTIFEPSPFRDYFREAWSPYFTMKGVLRDLRDDTLFMHQVTSFISSYQDCDEDR